MWWYRGSKTAEITTSDPTMLTKLQKIARANPDALTKFAISARNKWMVEASDVVISGVNHDWGGAWSTEKVARQKKKRIESIINNN